jgi:hypothetical protein
MPPRAGSPAIDNGLDLAGSLVTDQRGYARISGAHVDVGAVEAQFEPANFPPVLKLSRVLPGTALNFVFSGIPNADFTVLTTTNLALPVGQWDIFGTPGQISPGFYYFTDSVTNNSRARYYLVVSP